MMPRFPIMGTVPPGYLTELGGGASDKNGWGPPLTFIFQGDSPG